MSIDLVKVSPPKISTFGDIYNCIDPIASPIDESTKSITKFELSGGLGNRVMHTWYENNIGYSKGSVEDKTNAFCMSDTFRSNEVEITAIKIEEVIDENVIVNIKRWIKRHMLVVVLNYIGNEVLYEKLVNILSDDMIFEDDELIEN